MADFSALVRHADKTIQVPRGQVVFSEGDSARVLYAVKRGRVQVSIDGQVVEEIVEGGVFGEMSLIDERSRSATATAVDDTELVPVDREQFDRIVQLNPFLARSFMRLLADRLSAMNERLRSSPQT
jgi:CRP-like cAMP-binding protein